MAYEIKLNLELTGEEAEKLVEKAFSEEMTVDELIGHYVSGNINDLICDREFKLDTFLDFLDRTGKLEIYEYQLGQLQDQEKNILFWTEKMENPVENWEKYCDADGNQMYRNKEEYLADLQSSCEEEINNSKEDIQYLTKELEEYWNEYTEWTGKENPDKEEEIGQIKKLLENKVTFMYSQSS